MYVVHQQKFYPPMEQWFADICTRVFRFQAQQFPAVLESQVIITNFVSSSLKFTSMLTLDADLK